MKENCHVISILCISQHRYILFHRRKDNSFPIARNSLKSRLQTRRARLHAESDQCRASTDGIAIFFETITIRMARELFQHYLHRSLISVDYYERSQFGDSRARL